MASLISGLILACLVLLLARSLHAGLRTFRHNAAAVSHIPGYRIALHPHAILATWLPRLGCFFNIGEQYTWRYKHDLFAEYGSDLISVVSHIPHTRSVITCDPEAVKSLVTNRKRYIKPINMYKPLAMFGPNVGVTEGHEWIRHKRIVASSNLLENINVLAWQNTMKTLDLCFEDWRSQMESSGQRKVRTSNVVQLTLKLALFVILGAGFSHFPAWNDDAKESLTGAHSMSFRHALHNVLENVWWKIVLPTWAYKLPFCGFVRKIGTSFDEFGMYLQEMVHDRRQLGREAVDRRATDLLGALVQSSGADEEDAVPVEPEVKTSDKLSDQEVMGNIYVFLLAGHDTTAHTLAFTFGLLALYPDIQQKLLEEISSILPSASHDLTYETIAKLKYSHAVFLETLRLYPSVVVVPKFSLEDGYVPVHAFEADCDDTTISGPRQVHIPEYSDILIDVPGMHYNPRYWGNDAADFRPTRFLDNEETGYRWPREAFMGFSQGPRACLGQKFAQVEATTIITEIVRRFEIRIDPSALKAGESTAQARRRLLDSCKTVITLTPKPFPVVFVERMP